MQDMQPQEPNLNPTPIGAPAGGADHEGAMAKADLYKLAQYSFKLFKKLEDDAQLEAWVQAKITKAADYIASVYHYLEYEMEFSEYGKKIENSDVYSESQKIELKNKLMEAKEKVKSLKIAQADKMSVQEGTIFGGGEQPCSECGGTGVVMVPERAVPEAVKGKVEKYKRLTKAMHAASKRLDRNNNGIPDSMEGEAEVDEEVSSTGGTITRPKPGVTRHTHNPARFSDEPHGEEPSKAKSKSAAEKAGDKAADKQTEKDSKDWQKRFGKDSVTKVSAGKKEKKTDESVVGQGIYEGDMKVGDSKKTRTGILTKTKTGVVHKNTSYNDEEHGEPTSNVKSKSAAEKKADKEKEIKLPKHKGNTWGMKGGEKFGKKMEEGKKPDFLDLDKDGDKKEPMKKAAKEKKVEEGAPSAGMSKKEKSAVVKKAKAGGDIGKPGKNFEKVAKAAEKGGAKNGAAVAAAAMWKNAKKKVAESIEYVSEAEMPTDDDAILAQLAQTNPTGLQAATAAGPEAVAKLIQDTKAQATTTQAAPTMGAEPAAEPAADQAVAQPAATPVAEPAAPVAESVRMREQLARLNRYENLQVNESSEAAQLRKLSQLLG